jgi:ribonucleotide monophosphatase NagD (HAD superfamily)
VQWQQIVQSHENSTKYFKKQGVQRQQIVQSHESLKQILQKARCAAAADSAKAWKLSAHLKSKVWVLRCKFFSWVGWQCHTPKR